ncbi:hypothetical protein CFN78_02770 [Amycolatopsis antarctica]|uniref:Uncharacterized protein n=1 Tax=Amycolatopsis antarctica TaxID=1854586 RepID=A0A263DC81_9PSEU|nr:hypothetical protein [Amycolatopsis antarctica]OZM75107.1 hypothetical protein CFN78_02770 [Amycolatopsis antarctica]
MSVARKDDRHNDDLVSEISDGFNRALTAKDADQDGEKKEQPKFVVTGDSRTAPARNRRGR